MDKQNIAFLFGSGISFETLGKSSSVDSITKRIFNNPCSTDDEELIRDFSTIHSGAIGRESSKNPDPTRINQLIKFLRQIDREFGTSGEPLNYEDLYGILDQYLEDTEQVDSRNRIRAPERIEIIDNIASQIFGKYTKTSSSEIPSTRTVANQTRTWISLIVKQALTGTESPKGFDALIPLLNNPDINRIHFATLNHDLLLDQFLESFHNSNYGTCEVIHGFDAQTRLGEPNGKDFRLFDPASFRETTSPSYSSDKKQIILYKLHGSIDWIEIKSTPKNGEAFRKYIKTENILPKPDGIISVEYLPRFLTGNVLKYHQYLAGIFADMHTRFRDNLRFGIINHLIVSGYGFGDPGINLLIGEWLSEDPSQRKLHVLDKSLDKEKILEKLRHLPYSQQENFRDIIGSSIHSRKFYLSNLKEIRIKKGELSFS
ncbi:MAG: SIR2 family protein [Opitutales bacterium]|nr:SIR2 family protein [Opitutales bacterium]